MAPTSSATTGNANNTKKEKQAEFNPRWKGYVYIGLTSLVNFCSITTIPRDHRLSYWAASMTFGVLTFLLALIILIQDRSQKCLDFFHYTKAKSGYFEGCTLLFMVLWWVVGTAYTTRVGGIAYVANNIYFSSWLTLSSCVYTLNEWSASKDILSIAELTGVSATLKSWWLLFLSSLVVMGTCIDMHVRLGLDERDDTSFGVALGLVSIIISLFFIMVHYDFIPACEEGSWLELASSFFLILIWTIGLSLLTQDQGIAATIAGSQCGRDPAVLETENCTIIVYQENAEGSLAPVYIDCGDFPRQVPGSNLYLSAWTSFFAALNVTFRWKAAQALQFAHTQQEKQQKQMGNDNDDDDISRSDDEDDI